MSNNEKQADSNAEDQLDENITAESEEVGQDQDVHLLLEDARNKADQHWNDLFRQIWIIYANVILVILRMRTSLAWRSSSRKYYLYGTVWQWRLQLERMTMLI